MVAPGHGPHEYRTLTDLCCRYESLRVGADIVIETRPEGDWHVRDVTQINQFCLYFTSIVVWCKLLETVFKTILSPVLLRLDREWLSTAIASCVITDFLIEVIADSCDVSIPVRPAESVHAVFLEVHQSVTIYMITFVDGDSAWI